MVNELQPGHYFTRDMGDGEWIVAEVVESITGTRLWYPSGRCQYVHDLDQDERDRLYGPIPTPDDPRWKALVGR